MTKQLAIAASITDVMDIDEGEPRTTDGQLDDWRTEFIVYLSDGILRTEK